DRHREEDAEHDDRDLRRFADPEPEDEERKERDLRDREGRRDQRVADGLGEARKADGEADQYATERAQAEAEDDAPKAREDVRQEFARAQHRSAGLDHAERRSEEHTSEL